MILGVPDLINWAFKGDKVSESCVLTSQEHSTSLIRQMQRRELKKPTSLDAKPPIRPQPQEYLDFGLAGPQEKIPAALWHNFWPTELWDNTLF